METIWQDVRYGLRMLGRNPGFAAVAVVTLALGIGANTAIFSVLDPLVLRKLPIRNPDEVVLVHSSGTLQTIDFADYSDFERYRDKSDVFSGVLADAGMSEYEVRRGGRTSAASGEDVSENYFSVLGARAFAGRLFGDEGGKAHSEPEVVLSFDYWRREFNSDAAVIGQTVFLGGRELNPDPAVIGKFVGGLPYRIVGVTRPEFFGIEVGSSPDFYVPLEKGREKDRWVKILGRLRPGVTPAQAKAGLEPLFEQAVRESRIPAVELRQDMSQLLVTPAGRGLSELRERFLLPGQILMAAVGLVLLVACANVANLLIGRGIARKQEITVRLALGAGRGRMIRQLLTESALLAVMGATGGLLAAKWASGLLAKSLSAEGGSTVLMAGLGGRALLFTLALSVLTVLLCGLGPALSATRGDLAQGLKAHAGGMGQASSGSRMSRAMVVAQVALSVTLLAGAGLLLHSLVNLETFDAGFNRDKVLTVSLKGRGITYSREQVREFFEGLIDRAKALPGVRAAGISSFAPMSGREVGINVAVEGYQLHPREETHVFFTDVSPGYFETMGIPLLTGRDFTWQEREEQEMEKAKNIPPVIINRTMARHYFGEGQAVGRRIRFLEGNGEPMEIVGVVADSKYNDLREATPDFMYLSGLRRGALSAIMVDLDVRAEGNPKMLAGPLREIVQSLDSTVTITGMGTLRERIDPSLHQDRLIAALCGAFSLLALTLTCVGLGGLLSSGVARRTREIGIRMALGAEPRDIFRLVVGQGMRLTIGGLFFGAAGALACAALLRSLLFGVRLGDPVTFGGVGVLLAVVALAACYVPARRAMKLEPMVALRYE